MQKTSTPKKEDIKREWFLIDADNLVLGRLASTVANILMGKNKALVSRHMDMGDYVVITNAKKIALTGRKPVQKMYYRHSGFPGGFRETDLPKMLETKPEFVIEHAIKGMLPKDKLLSDRMARLYVYPEATHDKAAQQPKEFKLTK
jgi:large subunit ribosomal protein L13